MHPECCAIGARGGRTRVEPLLDPGERGVAATLHRAQQAHVAGRRVKRVVVVAEAAVQPRLRGEDERRDKRGGREAFGREDAGQRRHVLREWQRDVVAHAVLGWIATGEERRMRRPGDGHMRRRVERARALARQPVEVRRRHGGVAIGAQTVGSQGVDGHDHEVARHLHGDGRRVGVAAA